EHPSGKPLNELTLEEMAEIQGAGDVQPESSPLCVATVVTVGMYVSKKIC
ncbi:mersacidin family lantibiotic, partial [Bacillus mycoides]